MKLIAAFLYLLLLIHQGFAQNQAIPKVTTLAPNSAQGLGFFTTFDTDDGLAMDIISYGDKSAICDSKGNLWFGSAGAGVSRYNGKSFSTFTAEKGLINNTVWCIAEDRKGQLWFGMTGGVSVYDGKAFRRLQDTNKLADKTVNTLFVDSKDNIWLGTLDHGVFKYDGTSLTEFTTAQGLPSNQIKSIREDSKGNIWIASNGGISAYNGTSFKNYGEQDGLPSNRVQSMLVDVKDNLWLGTGIGKVSKFDGKSFKIYTLENVLTKAITYCITQDKEGNIWFGTKGNGVWKYDGESFINYTTKNGLANNIVRSITEDKQGNLWFGTKGGGVSKYEGESFLTLNKEYGLPGNIIKSIIEDEQGKLWFGSRLGGVASYDGKSFSTFSTDQGLMNDAIFSLLEDSKRNIWLGTLRGGLIKFDGKKFTDFTYGTDYSEEVVFGITEDRKGNIWFGTVQHGLVKYDGKTLTAFGTQQGLSSNNVHCIKEDSNGNLWIGTWGGGVNKFDGSSFTHYTTEQGLAYDIVLDILEDKNGNIWIGTYGGGINIIKSGISKRSENIQFETINKRDGLPDNGVAGLAQDKNGNIFVGTNFGLAVIPQGDVANGIEVYNQFNGYPIRDVNGGAFLCDSKDVLWVGTGSDKTALVRFEYNKIKKNTNKLKVSLEKVNIKGEATSWYNILPQEDSLLLSQQEIMAFDKTLSKKERDSIQTFFEGVQFDSLSSFYPIPYNLVLPFEHNALTFQFNAIETGRNYMINYQYMLKGMETSWHPPTPKDEAVYNNLSEGDYVFMVKAQSPQGVWTDVIEYQFKILPPWYRTWWAFMFYGSIIILIMVLIVKFNTYRLVQTKKQLERTVENRTAEIVNQKEEISRQNEQLQSLNQTKDKLFSIIGHDMRGPVANLKSTMDLITQGRLNQQDQQRFIKNLSVAVTSVEEMLTNTLYWAINNLQGIAPEPSLVQLSAAIETQLTPLLPIASEKGVQILHHQNEAITAFIDPNHFGIIIRNLVRNALKFTDKNGVISIYYEQSDKEITLYVKDTGVGMSKEKQEKLFVVYGNEISERGTQNESGTGIGLNLVHDFIQSNNGEVAVDSEVGGGTTFRVTFPQKYSI